MESASGSFHLGVIPDFAEEEWPSMDLAAEMLVAHLERATIRAHVLRPRFRARAGRIPLVGRHALARRIDIAYNRFLAYPRHIAGARRSAIHAYHICDHSYAHVAHSLPRDVVGVYCHDLDAFRCILGSGTGRPRWFRALAQRCLAGLQRAAIVFHSTMAVRTELLSYGLIDPRRMVHVPYGIAPEFHDCLPASFCSPARYVLHVGSCIPRKRVDIALAAFAAIRSRHPDLRFVQNGGSFTQAHRRQIGSLGIADVVEQRRGLPRHRLADLYRAAAVVLVPSELEGFGLPVIEGLASGAIVIASDIPALREVGGAAALYAPVGDVDAWSSQLALALDTPNLAPSPHVRRSHAAQYSWTEHAERIAAAYRRETCASSS